jgi:alanine dehydrogenase
VAGYDFASPCVPSFGLSAILGGVGLSLALACPQREPSVGVGILSETCVAAFGLPMVGRRHVELDSPSASCRSVLTIFSQLFPCGRCYLEDEMLYLSEQDVLRFLDMPRAVALMRDAFAELAARQVVNHPRRRVILPTGSVLHYMAAGDQRYFGAKVYASNPKTGAHFLFLLYRSDDATPLALMEANHLGQIRTGAVSGYATDVLARPDARVLGVLGSGFQAETQVAAIAVVRPLSEIRVWSRKPERRDAFAARLRELGHSGAFAAESAEAAVRHADIVVTATNAKDPVFDAGWVSPGTHINATGSNQAKRRELPPEILNRAAVIAVDSLEQAEMESGDLLLARAEGKWSGEGLVELADVRGRGASNDITIFKSNGLAIEDVVAAGWVYERAAAEGVGRPVG